MTKITESAIEEFAIEFGGIACLDNFFPPGFPFSVKKKLRVCGIFG